MYLEPYTDSYHRSVHDSATELFTRDATSGLLPLDVENYYCRQRQVLLFLS
jgi:hypothetical protein